MDKDIRQSSFAGGEYTPDVYGRIDMEAYGVGLRKCRNMIVTKYGGLLNKPGTRFVSETKSSLVRTRLIPFTFSDGQNFVLAFGDHNIRFYYQGGLATPAGAPAYAAGTTYRKDQYVTSAAVTYRSLQDANVGHTPVSSPTWWAAATVLEIESPYAEADLRMIKYAQEGDVVTLTCRGYDPIELRRSGNIDWRILSIPLDPPYVAPVDANWPALAVVYDMDQAVSGQKVVYDYYVTAVVVDVVGRRFETASYPNLPIQTTAPKGVPNTQIVDTTVADWSAAGVYNAGDIVALTTDWGSGGIYQGSNGLALVKMLFRSTVNGNGPNSNPMSGLGVSWEVLRTGAAEVYADPTSPQTLGRALSLSEHKPRIYWALPQGVGTGYVVEEFRLYRGREGVAGLIASIPVTVSETKGSFTDDGAEADFTIRPPMAFTEFNGDPPECVRFFQQRRTFARRGSIFMSKSGDYYRMDRPQYVLDDSPIQINLAAAQYEEVRWLASTRALLAGTGVTTPWVIEGAQGAPITPVNRSALAQEAHGASWLDPVIIGKTVLYVEDMGNGVRELQFDQNSDNYDSDETSLLAEHLFADGLEIVEWAYAHKPFGVLWGIRSDGKLIGLTYNKKHQVRAWHWHDTGMNGDQYDAYESVCAIQEGEEHAVYVVVARQVDGVTRRYVERFTTRKVPRINGVLDVKRGVFLDSSITYDGAPATVFSGLDHLEGRTVGVLADGVVLPQRVVVNGEISILADMPDGASVVTVGLPYYSDVEPLDVVTDRAESRSKIKRVVSVALEVLESISVLVGPSYDKLKEWRQRNVTDAYAVQVPFTGNTTINIPGSYRVEGRVCIRQENPLPIAILGLTREVDLGDD